MEKSFVLTRIQKIGVKQLLPDLGEALRQEI
jgi:hypothetical protein